MIEKDTIKLLRECDAGVKMGLCPFFYVLFGICERKRAADYT